jgi:heme exporter protein D
VVVGAIALVGLVVVFVQSGSDDRASLRGELGKAAIQVIVVAVIGTVLKLLVDRHQALAQRAEQDQRFRQEKYDRLVGVTNDLRRAP